MRFAPVQAISLASCRGVGMSAIGDSIWRRVRPPSECVRGIGFTEHSQENSLKSIRDLQTRSICCPPRRSYICRGSERALCLVQLPALLFEADSAVDGTFWELGRPMFFQIVGPTLLCSTGIRNMPGHQFDGAIVSYFDITSACRYGMAGKSGGMRVQNEAGNIWSFANVLRERCNR